MHSRLILTALVGLTGCVSHQPIDTATGEPLVLHWSCPKEGTVISGENVSGGGAESTFTRTYASVDANNPDICQTASGTRRLFDRWNLANYRVTPEEDKRLRNSMSAFMHGITNSAAFIARGQAGTDGVYLSTGGTQHSYFYRVTGVDEVQVGGQKIKAVHVHFDAVNGSNTNLSKGDMWYDPSSNVRIKSVLYPSSGTKPYSLQIKYLETPIEVDPTRLDVYAGRYRSTQTGSLISVERDGDHLLFSRNHESPQKEYPRTKHDFYYLNHGMQFDSFVTNQSGMVSQIIHRAEGKPDEIYSRMNASLAQN